MKKAAILWVLASGLFVATSASAQECVGDCNGDNMVAINELIIGVNIALGSAQVDACPSFDVNGDGMVTINELITAVNNALGDCVGGTPTPTPAAPIASSRSSRAFCSPIPAPPVPVCSRRASPVRTRRTASRRVR